MMENNKKKSWYSAKNAIYIDGSYIMYSWRCLQTAIEFGFCFTNIENSKWNWRCQQNFYDPNPNPNLTYVIVKIFFGGNQIQAYL